MASELANEEEGGASKEQNREFWAAIEQHTKLRIPVNGLPTEEVSEGLRRLRSSHRLCLAGVVPTDTPTLFVSLPSTIRALDVKSEDLVFVPYGWDTTFGGSLTISVALRQNRPASWIARLFLPGTDPILPSLESGRFVCVLTKNHVPALAVAVDMASRPEARTMFSDQWKRATTHRGLRADRDALFWQTMHYSRSVTDSFGLSPRDLLSLGWVNRYQAAISELDAEIRAFKELFSWPGSSPFPERWATWCRLFRDGPLSVDSLVEHVASEYAVGAQRLWELLSPDYHDAIHGVMRDHSPLCNAPIHAVESFLLGSTMTQSGTRVPILRGRDIGFHSVAPEQFAHVEADRYWARVIHLPAEWSSLVKGGDVPADLTKGSPLLAAMPKTEDGEATQQAAERLLDEALTERKWTIPPDAVLDLAIGPFSHVELRERDGAVDFILRTESREFSAGGVLLGKDERRLWWEALAIERDDERQIAARALYLMVAAVIRDFLVVEQREVVFGQRTVNRRGAGARDVDEPRVIYLPRVTYAGSANVQRCNADLAHTDATRRTHDVRPHLRRCDVPSTAQLFLARRYGMDVPIGYTFVRPHERGKQPRDVVYRSRSALQCLYRATPSGQPSRVGWFDFERDVYRAMERLGFRVEHVAAARRGDRGVDVYATKGTDLDRVCWVIQCKAYSLGHKVGPHVVRELVGTMAEYPRGTRGMIATTSGFTGDAQALASRHDVRLMDGKEFSALIAADSWSGA